MVYKSKSYSTCVQGIVDGEAWWVTVTACLILTPVARKI